MRFFKQAILVASLGVCGLAFGQSIESEAMDEPIPQNSPLYWLEKSRQLLETSDQMETPEWLRTKPAREALEAAEKLKVRADVIRNAVSSGKSADQAVNEWKEINKKAKQAAISKVPANVDESSLPPDLPRSFIFVSQSMPKAELEAAAEESSETGASIVFRGIKPGQAIDHVSKLFRDIVRSRKDLKPHVIINPKMYTQYEITSVPTTVVHLNGKVIKATGTLSIDYLISQLEEQKEGDLGLIGTAYEIAEPDMIEEMKRRAKLVDWQKLAEGAPDRFWTNSWQKFSLPAAEKNRSFLVDPVYVVSKDIVWQGKTIIPAGTAYNPQKALPMRSVVIVYDGTDDRQKKAVVKYIKENNIAPENVVLVVSEIDRKRGFEAYNELNRYFGLKNFVMDKTIVERFKIQAVPSVVSGHGDYYKVVEIGVGGILNE